VARLGASLKRRDAHAAAPARLIAQVRRPPFDARRATTFVPTAVQVRGLGGQQLRDGQRQVRA
jgi:hypothetical protein